MCLFKKILTIIFIISILFSQEMISVGEHNGNQYYVSETTVYWNDAQSICSSIGGHMITITSAEENDFLVELDRAI